MLESTGIVRYDKSRGAAVVDLNMDGALDLVVVERNANVQLWRNVGSVSNSPVTESTNDSSW